MFAMSCVASIQDCATRVVRGAVITVTVSSPDRAAKTPAGKDASLMYALGLGTASSTEPEPSEFVSAGMSDEYMQCSKTVTLSNLIFANWQK